MTVTTSYPGVYLSEEPSLTFTASHSGTTVPAFIFERFGNDDAPDPDVIVCYHSWAEFSATQTKAYPERNYYRSIYGWFMRGGGKCYLVYIHNINLISQYDDITLLVTAGISFYFDDISAKLTTLINNGQRIFGLFDTHDQKISAEQVAEKVMEKFPTSPHAAAFYPWCHLDDMVIPPTVIAALAIAKTDSTHGVWKAPANVVINGITPKYPVSNALQGRFMQGKALNMIRHFPDVGTVIWGERTLEDSDNWRYISVRRLFSLVEKDIQKALNNVIFEPNSQLIWQKVRGAVDNYLYRLWQQGALLGNQAQEAYFVSIGKGITMTADDIKAGKMIVKIGLAAVRPAEFIVLQFSQTIAQ